MKRKFRRSLLLVLLVFICIYLTGCKTNTNVSKLQVVFDSRTITVSSSEDNAFKLNLEITANSSTSYWTSDNLFVAKGVSHTYKLEDLVGNYISKEAQITSVTVDSTRIFDAFGTGFVIAVIFLVIGFILSIFISTLSDK